jgi:sulfatase modifying factor 1
MHDEAAFIQAIQEHPEDANLRQVFADWLEERGDARAELIRLLHMLTQSVEVPDRSKLEDRLRSLVAAGVQPVGPFWTNSIGMKFAWIPAGTFLMGSPEDEKGREEIENQHRVTLTGGFYLSVHAVPQPSWQEIMGSNPSHSQDNHLPVEQVSWDDCQEFLRKLSDRESQAYRMPTEAEWEYACRAGTTTPFSFGETILTDQANYNPWQLHGHIKEWQHYRGKATAVGSFLANAWGLHDMHGNVWEWCADWYGAYPPGDVIDPQGPKNGECRVLRGGSFDVGASGVRSAARHTYLPSIRYFYVGFRAARTVP